MTSTNFFTFLYDMIQQLSILCDTVYQFLFSTVYIGTLQVSMWGLLGGAGLVSLLIYGLVKILWR